MSGMAEEMYRQTCFLAKDRDRDREPRQRPRSRVGLFFWFGAQAGKAQAGKAGVVVIVAWEMRIHDMHAHA
jgi:hypothetical protein